MSLHLVIDIGNTRQKVAVFKNGKLKGKVHVAEPGNNKFTQLLLDHEPLTGMILSTVGKKWPSFSLRGKDLNIVRFTATTPVPVNNKYRSTFTLGSDRLASVVGASKLFKGSPVLVIDAGTCIKFNFINSSGHFLGGSISPGIQMRFKGLHNFTARLPLIDKGESTPSLIGNSTETSIRSGVINGAVEEVKGMIANYQKKYRNIKLVLTGGDAPLFVKSLKMRIFARPNLVLEGLNEILEYNV